MSFSLVTFSWDLQEKVTRLRCGNREPLNPRDSATLQTIIGHSTPILDRLFPTRSTASLPGGVTFPLKGGRDVRFFWVGVGVDSESLLGERLGREPHTGFSPREHANFKNSPI